MPRSKDESPRRVVGAMTGTSIDGIDVALVDLSGGNDMRAALVRHISRPLGDLASPLRRAAEQEPMSAGQFAALARRFGELHANVIGELLAGARADLIAVHGQTIYHRPPDSWQIVNPAPIAVRFGCPVVSDLRQADLARGGQGAPITPAADWVMFRHRERSRAIVNLGGFCNVTYLPADGGGDAADRVRGFDLCACNQVLDAVARLTLGKPFDDGGEAARRGRPDPEGTQELITLLHNQREGRRSLGTGDEAENWVRNRTASAAPDDLAATAVEAIARIVASTLADADVHEIVLAGGGARNGFLVERLTTHANLPIRLSDELGVPIEAREAMAIAILGAKQGGRSVFLPPGAIPFTLISQ